MADYNHGATIIPPEELVDGGVDSEMARKWLTLQGLQVSLLSLLGSYPGPLMHAMDFCACNRPYWEPHNHIAKVPPAVAKKTIRCRNK